MISSRQLEKVGSENQMQASVLETWSKIE